MTDLLSQLRAAAEAAARGQRMSIKVAPGEMPVMLHFEVVLALVAVAEAAYYQNKTWHAPIVTEALNALRALRPQEPI